MKHDTVYDIINLIAILLSPMLPIYLAYLKYPLYIQAIPLILLLIPFGLTIYKRYKETELIKIKMETNKAIILNPILTKLERVVGNQSIFSETTYVDEFLKTDIEIIGWRKYFETVGNRLRDRFYYFQYDLASFINNPKKVGKPFVDYLNRFYWLVRIYHEFYNAFAKLTEITKSYPIKANKTYAERIKTLEEDYKDYYTALKNLVDENEEVRKIFRGRYPLIESPKEIKFR